MGARRCDCKALTLYLPHTRPLKCNARLIKTCTYVCNTSSHLQTISSNQTMTREGNNVSGFSFSKYFLFCLLYLLVLTIGTFKKTSSLKVKCAIFGGWFQGLENQILLVLLHFYQCIYGQYAKLFPILKS